MENIKAHIVIDDIKDAGKWGRKITAQIDAISPMYPTTNIELADEIFEGVVTIGMGYTVILEPSSLKNSGVDPDKTWNYYWKIISWGVESEDSEGDLPWGDDYPAEDPPKPPAPVKTGNGKTFFDATAGQRYTQHCTNVRTALMQAREMMTENGAFIEMEVGQCFRLADSILEFLNSRTFATSPLVTKAVNEGAVPVEVKDIPPKDSLNDSWNIPSRIQNGADLKKAFLDNGLEMDWVLENPFKRLGIARSVDYVSAERGSYKDVLIAVLLDAQKQGIEKSENEEI